MKMKKRVQMIGKKMMETLEEVKKVMKIAKKKVQMKRIVAGKTVIIMAKIVKKRTMIFK